MLMREWEGRGDWAKVWEQEINPKQKLSEGSLSEQPRAPQGKEAPGAERVKPTLAFPMFRIQSLLEPSFGFRTVSPGHVGCAKFSWSGHSEDSCPPLASDREHWTWPHSQRKGCCQVGSGCERPRGSYVGSNSQVSVSRHWWKQERWGDKQRFMRKQKTTAASTGSLLLPCAASAGLEELWPLTLPWLSFVCSRRILALKGRAN